MNVTHLESASRKVMPRLWLVIPLVCALCAAIVPADASPNSAMLVDAGAIVPGLVANIRYAGSHNFVGRPINGYRAPRCLLTQPAANALAEVARDLAARGLVIKVFDCYRPARAVADFVRWARDPRDQAAKAEFYPELDKGTPFDFFSPRSWTAASSVTAEQHANRMRLAAAMQRRGFRGYPKEWWHFTLRNEPFPGTYFDVPVQ